MNVKRTSTVPFNWLLGVTIQILDFAALPMSAEIYMYMHPYKNHIHVHEYYIVYFL